MTASILLASEVSLAGAATSINFVATNTRYKHVFVATKHVFCQDKYTFVAATKDGFLHTKTKMILVAAPANDTEDSSCRRRTLCEDLRQDVPPSTAC